jgi:3-hydroxyacyl-[acyl-carrier-protein] dehydratase
MEAGNDDLFIVYSLIHTDGIIKADLSINSGSSIFKGHFPGQPVVPGACMLQLVKDVLERALGYSAQLKKAGNLKFIGMIDPLVTPSVQLEMSYKIDEETINITAKLSDRDRICFKMQGGFVRA